MTFQESPSESDTDFAQLEALPLIPVSSNMLMWELREKVAELIQEVEESERIIHAAAANKRLNVLEIQAMEKFKDGYSPVIKQLKKEINSPTPTFNDVHAFYDVGLKYLGRLDLIVTRLSIH